MYDRETAEFIRQAPPAGGLDVARLPELLTESYIRIAALRLMLNDPNDEEAAEVKSSVARLRSLARLLEIYAALAAQSEKREAAAFVSATAHQLLLQASEVLSGDQLPLSISAETISPQISAALLFLAAGYPADASEIMSATPIVTSETPYWPLLRAIRSFCTGEMEDISRYSLTLSNADSLEERAEFSLWQRLLDVIQLMAARYVDGSLVQEQGVQDPGELLAAIRRDSVEGIELGDAAGEPVAVFSTFAGPNHLATLLLAAGRGLAERALVDVPPPDGAPESQWRRFVRERARKRPFLWANHMSALRQGLLNAGVSAVISFPTGAGKSTLSELKIASTIMRGKRVVYLAPTIALVNQVAGSLRRLLPEDQIVAPSNVDDQLYAGLEAVLEGSVSVMTPERCLLLATILPERFSDVGLIVFDECHSLHMDRQFPDRRGLDAMLCLLRLMENAPDADILLMSAMVANAPELAEWLRESHGKITHVFDASWKPTRQARGGIIFRHSELLPLQQKLRNLREDQNIPQRELLAVPHALVSLQQTWASNNGNDYRVLAFSREKSRLQGVRTGSNRVPRLKPDTSSLAIDIAWQSAREGLKSIVFFHTPSSVPSSVHKVGSLHGVGDLDMEPQEILILDALSRELGGEQFVYRPNSVAGGHHGPMLPLERELVERAFAREGGINILFSTNTLAQGMNLPADQVIIVRTSSYDSNSESYRPVDVHELLNAAGRAGRAGHAANGLVLVIPNDIVSYNDQTGALPGETIRNLKNEVLALDDRCLTVSDPIEVLLDRCLLAPEANRKLLDSLAVRLPAGNDERDAEVAPRQFFSRSLAAFRARKSANEAEFSQKVDLMLQRRKSLIKPETPLSVASVSSRTGLLPETVASMLEGLRKIDSPNTMGPTEWIRWLDEWLESAPEAFEVLRGPIPPLKGNVLSCLELWLNGGTFKEIELMLGTSERQLKYLTKAREFSKGLSREVSYLVGLVAQVAAGSDLIKAKEIEAQASLSAALIREGVGSLGELILLQHMRDKYWTRVRVHEDAAEWLSLVKPAVPGESGSDAERRILEGIVLYESAGQAA